MRRRTFLRASVVASVPLVGGCSELASGDGTAANTTGSESGGTRTGDTPPGPTDSAPPATDSGITATGATIPFEIGSVENCTVSNRPRPTPVAGYSRREYPAVPDPLTVSSAETFAERYEEAYRFNSYLDTEANAETEQLSVDSRVSEELTERVSDGYLVGVEGDLSVAQGDIVEDNPSVGIYYLSSAIAIRGDIQSSTLYDVSSLRSVTTENQRVLYCGGNDGE